MCHTSIKFCIVVPKCAIQVLNFVLWCLIFLCAQYQTCFKSSNWHLELWVHTLTFAKVLHPYVTGSFICLGKSIHNALNTRLGETPNQSDESSDDNENPNAMIWSIF